MINPNYHYVVDGQRMTSKNQAMIMAGGDVSRIHFYNMEHVWDHADWQEPTETFDELCVARCRQLRDQYDHLCLWLSAGYDSQTILASFIRAGIKIDEISYKNRGEYYDDPEIPFVLESIKHYKDTYNKNLRVQLVDVNYDYTRNLYLQLKGEWILQPTDGSVRVSKSIASFVQRYHEGVLRNRDATIGTRADIYGKEKPKLDLRDGQWYMQSNDATVRDMMAASIVEFYISADMPQLYVKQCHMAMGFFESLPNIDHTLVHSIQSMNQLYYQKWNLALGRVPVACPMSRHGELKTHFSNAANSYDGHRMLAQLKNTNDPAWKYFNEGLVCLTDSTTKSTTLSPTILGKAWPIRQFIHAEKIPT